MRRSSTRSYVTLLGLFVLWIVPTAAFARTTAAPLAEQARWMAQSGRLTQSAALYEQAIEADPLHAPSYVGLSAVLARLKQHRRAIATLDRAGKALPRDARIKAQLGLHLAALGRLQRARQVLGQALRADPSAHGAALILGEVSLKLERWSEARAALSAYLARRPPAERARDRRARLGLTLALLGQGQHAAARRELTALLRARPRDVAARVLQATLHADTGRCRRALTLLAALSQHAAAVPSILYNRALCQHRLGQQGRAMASLARYGARRPGRAETSRLRAKIHLRRGELERALAAFRQAAARGAEVRGELGRLLLRKGAAQRARTLAERALASAPPPRIARELQIVLGRALLRLKRPGLLVARLEPLEGDARGRVVLHLLGRAYVAQGKLELAAKRFNAALAAGHQPSRLAAVAALQRLSSRHARDKALDRAEAALDSALKLAPGRGALWRRLGLVRLLRNDATGAREALGAALKHGAAGPRTHHLLGRALLASGDADAALRRYRRGLRAAGASPMAERLELEIALLEARRGALPAAIERLERIVGRGGALARTARRDQTLARFKLGLRHLERKAYRPALKALLGAAAHKETLEASTRRDLGCALALARANAGQGRQALATLARVGQACTFNAALDPVGPDYLRAYALYRAGGAANLRGAIKLLSAALGRAGGAGKAALVRLLRSAHEAQALTASRSGDLRRARLELTSAARLGAAGPTHQYNVAVLDALQGRWAAATRAFARLGNTPPEARIGLGLGYARGGDQGRALRQLELAQKAGLDASWLRQRVALLRALVDRCTASGGAP